MPVALPTTWFLSVFLPPVGFSDYLWPRGGGYCLQGFRNCIVWKLALSMVSLLNPVSEANFILGAVIVYEGVYCLHLGVSVAWTWSDLTWPSSACSGSTLVRHAQAELMHAQH